MNKATINANELRIGNYFIGKDGQTYKVAEISMGAGHYIVGMNEEKACFTDIPNPIQLTPEILTRAGFENTYRNCYRNPSLPTLDFSHTGSGFKVLNDDGTVLCFIDYLHEMQNLFHIITKTELIINL